MGDVCSRISNAIPKANQRKVTLASLLIYTVLFICKGFPGGSEVKVSACNAGDLGLIPGSERSPGERNGNPLQYSCPKNPMDGGAWWATVHGVAKSQTQLKSCQSTKLKTELKKKKNHLLKGTGLGPTLPRAGRL